MNVFEGNLISKGIKVGIVASRFNEFITSKYCIPEEEMIMWSCTSLKAPLNEAGFKRYMQLFKEVFGFLPWEDE